MPEEDAVQELASLAAELAALIAKLREAVSRVAPAADGSRGAKTPSPRELARASLDEAERARRRGLDGGWLP